MWIQMQAEQLRFGVVSEGLVIRATGRQEIKQKRIENERLRSHRRKQSLTATRWKVGWDRA
jgi:hypothetical protein